MIARVKRDTAGKDMADQYLSQAAKWFGIKY